MKVVLWIVFIGIILLGAIIGYRVGDLLINSADYVRTKDILECSVGLPIIGAAIAFIPALSASQSIYDKYL